VDASSREMHRTDVLIGGAGFAGLALAIALRQGLGSAFSVTVADPALARGAGDPRASAIVAAARRLFETIGVWQAVEAQPILDMVVTDSRLQDAVRPTFLTFDGDVEPDEPFAHMIENGPLLAALVAKAKEEGVALRPTAVVEFSPSPRPGSAEENAARAPSRCVDVQLADDTELSARLLVAADGAHSAIRERAGIASHGWSYGQSAITTAGPRSISCRRGRSRSCR
jgi:2-octaprenyl-6-methoxyphenol hydroxylase